MPYVTFKLTLNQALLDKMREMQPRAAQKFKTRIATELVPELQKSVNDLFEQGPSPVDSPFHFVNDASKFKYYWMVSHGEVPFENGHYLRQPGPDSIQGGFRVETSTTRFAMGMVQVRNLHPKASLVFGPGSVLGHFLTGWPDQMETARELLREQTLVWLRTNWGESVREAVKETI